MKKILLCALATMTFAACGTKEKSVTGVIFDASMNTIFVVDNATGDTLVFSTMDAQIESPNGILIGDTAQLFYAGHAVVGMNESANVAQKVIVTSALHADPILGSWTQPIEGMDGVQGIKFDLNGTASSINMNTLVYESWVQNGDTIVLKGKSIGNGQTIEFEQKAAVQKLDADSLVLNVDGVVLRFAKTK